MSCDGTVSYGEDEDPNPEEQTYLGGPYQDGRVLVSHLSCFFEFYRISHDFQSNVGRIDQFGFISPLELFQVQVKLGKRSSQTLGRTASGCNVLGEY